MLDACNLDANHGPEKTKTRAADGEKQGRKGKVFLLLPHCFVAAASQLTTICKDADAHPPPVPVSLTPMAPSKARSPRLARACFGVGGASAEMHFRLSKRFSPTSVMHFATRVKCTGGKKGRCVYSTMAWIWIRIACPHQPVTCVPSILIIVLPAHRPQQDACNSRPTNCLDSKMHPQQNRSCGLVIEPLSGSRMRRAKLPVPGLERQVITTVADAICKLGSALQIRLTVSCCYKSSLIYDIKSLPAEDAGYSTEPGCGLIGLEIPR
ncbi:hypothetical protein J3F84DRAFT_356857 [Trichoderma pleuroticola]